MWEIDWREIKMDERLEGNILDEKWRVKFW